MDLNSIRRSLIGCRRRSFERTEGLIFKVVERSSALHKQVIFSAFISVFFLVLVTGIYQFSGQSFPSPTMLALVWIGLVSEVPISILFALLMAYVREYHVGPFVGEFVTPDERAVHFAILTTIYLASAAVGSFLRTLIQRQARLRTEAEISKRQSMEKSATLARTQEQLMTLNARLEAKVSSKTSELQSIINTIPGAFFMKNTSGRIVMANNLFAEFCGKERDQVIGCFESALWDRNNLVHNKDVDEKILSSKESISYERIVAQEDGMHIYYVVRFPIFSEKKEIRAICCLISDVTEVRRVELEKSILETREKLAQESSRLKTEFLANMSHEIRTPINGIIGMTSLLAQTKLDGDQRKIVSSVEKSSAVLMALINDILDLSKIESEKMDFESVPFSLDDLIRDTAACFEPLMQARSLNFKIRMDIRNTVYFLGDPGRIRQILNNLINNAMKFTETGSIKVSVHLSSTISDYLKVRFEVIDTGIGISDEIKPKLFSQFTQGDGSTNRRYGGSGLGLVISKRLVELMGGTIGFNSTLGKGSAFYFEVNLKQLTLEEVKQLQVKEESGADDFPVLTFEQRRKKRVLIAEDNVINQEIAVRMVSKAGYQTQAVSNGFEVLSIVESRNFDLILMDCQMPEMDGYDATIRIRNNGINIPILALTAHAFKEDKEKCLKAGMSDFISKPVTEEALIKRIDKWILTAGGNMEILDANVIRKLQDLDEEGNDKLVQRLVNLYLSTMPENVLKLKRLAEKPDSQLTRLAHTMRSANANLGAVRVADLLERIENSRFGEGELPEIVHELEKEVERAQDALRHYS